MQEIPDQYVLTIKPKEYLQQGPSHCGAYSVKAILSAYGLDTKTHPKYYHPHWLGRLTGSTFGRQYYVNILKNHGVDAEIKIPDGITDKDRIILLKKLLSRNTPVMIRIGNGYVTNEYNPIIGRFVPHWITLWGYDNHKQFFYIYDSGLPKQYWNENLPIGNTTREYEEILRDWRFGNWQVYTWPLVGRSDYLYIEVKNPNTTLNTIEVSHATQVSNGLKVLDKVFNKQHINYRVLGSVLVASLNGKPHRKLGDIDVLVDETDYEKVISNLQTEGYSIETKHKFGFNWTEAHHDENLGFTFLLIGKFSKDYFSCKLTTNIELRISTRYLEPTEYSLLGISFVGIPMKSIYEGLKISSLNPKRTLDKRVVSDYLKGNIPSGETLDCSFKVYFSGVEIPHAYTLFSQLYNIYGGLRVLLGRKYEIWD